MRLPENFALQYLKPSAPERDATGERSVSLAKIALDKKMAHFVVQRTSCGHPKVLPKQIYCVPVHFNLLNIALQ